MKYGEALPIEKTFQTTEYSLAVTLSYFDCRLLALDRTPGSPERITFVFERNTDLDQLVQGFWNDSLQCSPKKWHALSRELKARIKSESSMRGGGF